MTILGALCNANNHENAGQNAGNTVGSFLGGTNKVWPICSGDLYPEHKAHA